MLCVRKPLIATCAADKSVRIWNYVDKTMELMRTFEEDPCSIALHPNGLHVLVGFTDKLRLMNLLMDDIRTFKEFSIKACIECKFSRGGDLFAAAAGNAVNVYNFYTFVCIAQLRGHNQKVLSLNFDPSGTSLLSAGMDGGVICWDLNKGVRTGELNQKGVVYTSAAIGPNGEALAAGTDKLIKNQDLKTLLQINIGAAAEINRLVFKSKVYNKNLKLVHVGSIASNEAVGSVGYNVSKSALAAYVRSLGRELYKKNVIVTGILPGGFIAPGNAMERLKNKNIKDYKKFIKMRIPRASMGNVNEVLPMLLFLCSKHSAMMGGCLVPIDAGEGKAYQI